MIDDVSTYLARMVPPSQVRPPVWHGGVLQIHVGRACDRACVGCTQASNLGGAAPFMTPEQFETACKSLEGYFGVVGVFGGNPAVSPHFEAYCEILARYVPFERRGLWCNHPRGKGAAMRRTFNPGVSNLNVHLDREAWDEFGRDWPEAMPFGLTEDSHHSPPYVAMRDVIHDERERWELISRCDINHKWSAMVCVIRGDVLGFFCEMAGAIAMMHGFNCGVPAVPGWWRAGMDAFEDQVRWACHRCGIPLRGRGDMAATGNVERVSETHRAVFRTKVKTRTVELVTNREQLGSVDDVTKYLQNARGA